jgi:hypothetical protein
MKRGRLRRERAALVVFDRSIQHAKYGSRIQENVFGTQAMLV